MRHGSGKLRQLVLIAVCTASGHLAGCAPMADPEQERDYAISVSRGDLSPCRTSYTGRRSPSDEEMAEFRGRTYREHVVYPFRAECLIDQLGVDALTDWARREDPLARYSLAVLAAERDGCRRSEAILSLLSLASDAKSDDASLPRWRLPEARYSMAIYMQICRMEGWEKEVVASIQRGFDAERAFPAI